MAEFSSVGYGIGEALNRAAENLTANARLQFQERERQADAYAQQAHDILANVMQLGGPDAPEAKPYMDQVREVLNKHNALYPAGETSTLVQRLGRLFGRRKGPQGQQVATPESVPGMEVTTGGELLPGQLDVQGRSRPWQQANIPGLIEPGNIENLFNRPVLQNPDGTLSTTISTSFNLDGQEVLIPTVVDGKRLSDQEAIDYYRRTGQHLGKFKDPASADAYATALHNEQEQRGQGTGETISGRAPIQRTFVPPQRLLPRTMQVAGPGQRPPLQWLSPEEMVAATPRRQNAILQELQDLRQAFKAGGQSDEEAGQNAMKALQRKYGVNLPGKAPRIERDPVSHDVINVIDEDTGTPYDATNIGTAPQNVQQAWNSAQRGQATRPEAVKTEFELFMRQYPTATVQDWADFRAKEARKGKTRKEQIQEEIADAVEKGDRATIQRKQSELMAIDPAGAERLQFASENLSLREVANVARQEAAKTKRIVPLQGIVDTADNAARLKQMGDSGNASADVDLTLEFFKTIRGAEGSGIRFSQNEQNFITGARGLSEALEVRGNQVFANGQPLAAEQRQRMLNVIQMHATAAKRRIDEIQNEQDLTPGNLKERAKPKTPTAAPQSRSDKESLLEEINK